MSERLGWNDDGTLDEVCLEGALHMEQMDFGVYWFAVYRGDKRFSWTLSGQSPIEARVQDNDFALPEPENSAERWARPFDVTSETLDADFETVLLRHAAGTLSLVAAIRLLLDLTAAPITPVQPSVPPTEETK